MKYLTLIPLFFSLASPVFCTTEAFVRGMRKSDNISPMKINFSDARREATFDLAPARIIVSDDQSPRLARFAMHFSFLRDSERRKFLPFRGTNNVQVTASDQPSEAVAVKCVFTDHRGNIMNSDDLIVNGVFDAGTTVTKPPRAEGVVCDAYYYDPPPTDIVGNFNRQTLKILN